MKTSHRFALIIVPLGLLAAAVFFFRRTDGMLGRAERRITKIEKAVRLVSGAARADLHQQIEAAREEEQGALAQRGFWMFAMGICGFFVLLAAAFIALEIRHSRRRDALLAELAKLDPPPDPPAS